MSTPFTGQLLLVAFNYEPYQWAFAAGQLMAISQNTALFSLLGTNFGGDGRTTFGLPNLQANLAVGQGGSPSGTTYEIGDTGGAPLEPLTNSQIPPHSHVVNAKVSRTENDKPGNGAFGQSPSSSNAYSNAARPTLKSMSATSLTGFNGGNQPHNNMMPFLAMNWIIALYGVYPPRS